MAQSIERQGLLQPIVVCEAQDPSKWEILTGQRRFLAHKLLRRETIAAAVLDKRVGEAEAKAISITENLIRRRLSGVELKNGLLYLYNIYGTVKDVVEATGLPMHQVRDYVKYPRLVKELKVLVDEGQVDVNAALRAQDACGDREGNVDVEMAKKLAFEVSPMTDVQRRELGRFRRDHPDRSMEDVLEAARSGIDVIQIVVKISDETHSALRRLAREENTNQDEAAATLIQEGLVERGLLEG